jgi:hypothetical protein
LHLAEYAQQHIFGGLGQQPDEGRRVCAVAKVLKVHRTTQYRALASAAEDGHETVSPIQDGPW